MRAPLSHQRAIAELLFACVLWGFSFAAAKWLLLGLGPIWGNTLRFFLAFFVALPILYLSPTLWRCSNWKQFQLAMLPGLLLGMTLLLQMLGLQYTTVTKCGFITVLYVVMVPLFEGPMFGRRVSWAHLLWVALSLIGVGLICRLEANDWNRGDLFILAGAFTATLQILRLEAIRDHIESAFVFNVFQSFWAGLLPLIFSVPFDKITFGPFPWQTWVALFFLAIGVSLIAFLIQVRAQQILNSSLVSMLFLIESPFAALFAYLIFGETLVLSQWIGALLILVAAAGSVHLHVRLPVRIKAVV